MTALFFYFYIDNILTISHCYNFNKIFYEAVWQNLPDGKIFFKKLFRRFYQIKLFCGNNCFVDSTKMEQGEVVKKLTGRPEKIFKKN